LKITDDSEFIKRIEKYASRLAIASDLRSLFSTVEDIIDEIIDVQYLVLYYYNSHFSRFKAVTSKGLSKSARFFVEKTAMERHPGKAWNKREIIYIPDIDDESEFLSTFFEKKEILRSRLYIPVFKNEHCIGVFALASKETNHFSPKVISILSFVTNLAAVVYKNLIDTRDLSRVNRRLKEINRSFLSQRLQSIGQLAAGIAHELNTPLQYIGDNISFLNSAFEMLTLYIESINELVDKFDDYSKEKIKDIILKTKVETDINFFIEEIPPAVCQSLDGIARLNRIIRTIKDFSHPVTKEKTFKNINKSVEDSILITRNEWKNCADIRTELTQDLPLVYCQADEINQVVLQLLINAIEAINEKINYRKNYKIGIIVISTFYDDNGVSFTISDDGIGITAQNLDKIFDPFYTTKSPGKATGQGLAIAHDVICNKHNGDIFVQSNYLKGSKFIVKLPIS